MEQLAAELGILLGQSTASILEWLMMGMTAQEIIAQFGMNA